MLILKPSLIHGVGVFTTELIRQGAELQLFEEGDAKFMKYFPAGWLGRFCMKTNDNGGGYYAPKNIHRMSIGWYLNHDRQPNLSQRFTPIRDIHEGEELTINYEGLRYEE